MKLQQPQTSISPLVALGISPNDSATVPGIEIELEGDQDDATEQTFPLYLLPEEMHGIISETTEAFMLPASLSAACTLAAVACVTGAGLEVYSDRAQNATLRANIFLMPVAKSGTGKGRAYDEIMRPLNAAAKRAREKWEENVLPSIESAKHSAEAIIGKCKKVIGNKKSSSADVHSARLEMADAVKEKSQAEKDEKSLPCWNAGECTREALANIASGQIGEAVSVMSSEARGIISVISGRYAKGGSDEDIYLSLYSGDSISINRKLSPPVNLNRPCGTALLMIQPDKVSELMGKANMTESGLLPRFCAWDAKADSEPLPEVPHRISAAARDSWKDLIEALASEYRSKGDTPRIVTPSPEAFTVMHTFENECRRDRHAGGKHADVASYSARWAENAWKLALILHAGQHGADAHMHPLTEATTKDAVELMRWFIAGQLELLAVGRNQKRQARLADLVGLLATGPKTLRDLAKSHGFDKEEVLALSAAAQQTVEVVTLSNEKGGPKSRVARLV